MAAKQKERADAAEIIIYSLLSPERKMALWRRRFPVVEKKKKNVRAFIVPKPRFEVDESLFRATKRICEINRRRRPHG